jgi:hypothetical protein
MREIHEHHAFNFLDPSSGGRETPLVSAFPWQYWIFLMMDIITILLPKILLPLCPKVSYNLALGLVFSSLSKRLIEPPGSKYSLPR